MYVEDYIDLLAGKIACEHCNNYDIVKLAKYDYSPVRNISRIVESDRGLSDRQRELAIKIVHTYRRQFAKHGYDCEHVVENPKWRSPLRTVDRTKLVCIKDHRLTVKFPFEPTMVDHFRNLQRYSSEKYPWIGEIEWNKTEKHWTFCLTEHNMLGIYNLTKNKNFEYCNNFNTIITKILKVKKSKNAYQIICDIVDGKIKIHNASESLQQSFDAQVTGDLLLDIGLAKRLGVNKYSLSVLRYLRKKNPLLVKLVAKRVLWFKKSSSLHEISALADDIGLLPMGNHTHYDPPKSVFFKETIYGLKSKYLEQRVSLVLYCTQYAPWGIEDAYYLEGY